MFLLIMEILFQKLYLTVIMTELEIEGFKETKQIKIQVGSHCLKYKEDDIKMFGRKVAHCGKEYERLNNKISVETNVFHK